MARLCACENWDCIHRWGSRRHVQGQHSCRKLAGKGCDLSQGPGGWLQLGWKPSESFRRQRNHRCLEETATRLSRKSSTGFCSLSSVQSPHTEAEPGTPPRCPGRAAGSALCSGKRPGSPGCPGGTARRGNKGFRSQKPTFTPRPHARPLPHRPRAYRRSLGRRGAGRGAPPAAGGARPSAAERSGRGREGTGVEGRREAGRRPALAAGSGGGSR